MKYGYVSIGANPAIATDTYGPYGPLYGQSWRLIRVYLSLTSGTGTGTRSLSVGIGANIVGMKYKVMTLETSTASTTVTAIGDSTGQATTTFDNTPEVANGELVFIEPSIISGDGFSFLLVVQVV